MGVRTEHVQPGNIGATLEGLAGTIRGRRDADPQQSYTARLLAGEEDSLLKKVVEEAGEVVMACKDDDHEHIRYEAGDLIYHLLVVLHPAGDEAPPVEGKLVDAHAKSNLTGMPWAAMYSLTWRIE